MERVFQYELPTVPVLKEELGGKLKPRGTPTSKTESVMREAASKFALTADQLRMIIDQFGPESYQPVAYAVSGLMHDQHMTFENALDAIEFV